MTYAGVILCRSMGTSASAGVYVIHSLPSQGSFRDYRKSNATSTERGWNFPCVSELCMVSFFLSTFMSSIFLQQARRIPSHLRQHNFRYQATKRFLRWEQDLKQDSLFVIVVGCRICCLIHIWSVVPLLIFFDENNIGDQHASLWESVTLSLCIYHMSPFV